MTTQPTAGPWTVGPHQQIISQGWSIRISDGSAIAYVLGNKNPELQANAHLISAAPAMLQALERIHANAAESPEWIRRTAQEALKQTQGA
jgi:hypothetical protein